MLCWTGVPARTVSYLLVCYSYPPVLGGSEIEAQRVCDALQKRGYGVKIVCAGGAPMPPVADWVDPCGLRVKLLGGRWPERVRGYVFTLGVIWTLISERRNYQIVYFLMHGLHVALGVPVAHLLGKPVVMKFSGSSLVAMMTQSFVGRMQVRFLGRWASRVLILNPGMVGNPEAGLDPALLEWMPNPVDTGKFRPCSPEERARVRQELQITPDSPLVVFVGRLDPPEGAALADPSLRPGGQAAAARPTRAGGRGIPPGADRSTGARSCD